MDSTACSYPTFTPRTILMPCAQQKCLIHLMRDINEDLHKSPFDDELKEIARRFGALLREIVETIDTHGLKTRHLGRHRKAAERFIEHVVAMKCADGGRTGASRSELKRTGIDCSRSSTTMACLGTITMPSMRCALLRVCGTKSARTRPRAPANTPRC